MARYDSSARTEQQRYSTKCDTSSASRMHARTDKTQKSCKLADSVLSRGEFGSGQTSQRLHCKNTASEQNEQRKERNAEGGDGGAPSGSSCRSTAQPCAPITSRKSGQHKLHCDTVLKHNPFYGHCRPACLLSEHALITH